MTNFAQPVSMRVTEEQFEADLRKPLEELGYIFNMEWYYGAPRVLVNNFCAMGRCATLIQNESLHNRYFIDHYNPALFLALAAMREGDEPHVGEWFIALQSWYDEDIPRRKGDMIRVTSTDPWGSEDNGMTSYYNRDYWYKASKEQIIAHFTKNKTMNKKITGYKLIKPEYRDACREICPAKRWFDKYFDSNTSKHCSFVSGESKEEYEVYHSFKDAGVLDLWFAPIYEQEDRYLTVTCDQGEFKVKVVPEGFEFEGKVVTLQRLNEIAQRSFVGEVNCWDINYSKVDIGCKKNIPISEIHKLIQEHGK